MPQLARRLKAWSHSRLLTFEQCKFRAWLQYGERVPDPKPRTAADRGEAIHKGAEDFVCGKLKALPAELKKFSAEFDALKRLYKAGKVSLEGEWAFDQEWNPVDWRDYDNVWSRVKADAVVWLTDEHVLVIDYKSGKRYGNEIKHGEQMQLYMLSIFLRYPKVKTVTVELWYVDLDDLVPGIYTREQGLRFLRPYTQRGLTMTNEERFPPNPNIFSCKWCPYGPKGTGHCKAGVVPNAPPRPMKRFNKPFDRVL